MEHSVGPMSNQMRQASRGETLVETIVSFAVLLMILAMITTLVMAAIRLNNRAMERAAALESASAAVLLGEGDELGSGSVIFDYSAIGDPLNTTNSIGITVMDTDAGAPLSLRYFVLAPAGGGGG